MVTLTEMPRCPRSPLGTEVAAVPTMDPWKAWNERGFSIAAAWTALQATNGDTGLAVERLLLQPQVVHDPWSAPLPPSPPAVERLRLQPPVVHDPWSAPLLPPPPTVERLLLQPHMVHDPWSAPSAKACAVSFVAQATPLVAPLIVPSSAPGMVQGDPGTASPQPLSTIIARKLKERRSRGTASPEQGALLLDAARGSGLWPSPQPPAVMVAPAVASSTAFLAPVAGHGTCAPAEALRLDHLPSATATASVAATDMEAVVNMPPGWKMAFAESWQRHYYWNIETLEVAWEVPVANALVPTVAAPASASTAQPTVAPAVASQ